VAAPIRVLSADLRRQQCRVINGFEPVHDCSARMTRRTLFACLLALITFACAREQAPAGITCEKLRSLRAGMPIEEAGRLLGTPPIDDQQDGHTVFSSKRADRLWGWPGPGVKLYIEFGQGRLIKADSWIRTMWRDLFDNESRPTLFTLKEDGTFEEGQDFKRIYCP
jgi:hypothetical protein